MRKAGLVILTITVVLLSGDVMAGQKGKGSYPPIPVMRCTDFDGPYHPTTLSSGLVGISPNKNPLTDSTTFVGDNQTVVAGFVHA